MSTLVQEPPTLIPRLHKSGRLSHTHTHTRTFSGASQHVRRTSLLCMLEPAILAVFLHHIPWKSFFALSQACRDVRTLFDKSVTARDLILSHFVPTYRDALALRDLTRLQEISVTLHDIDLLLMSQRMSLHQYPMHTLALNSALFTTTDLERKTRMLVAMAQAHSRFVLLIQSLVHSSPLPPIPEPVESRYRSRLSQPSLRELTFPAPLSISARNTNTESSPGHSTSRCRNSDVSRGTLDASSSNKNTLRKNNRMSRRLSVFDFGRLPPPPPPPSEPKELSYYSRSWRRSMYSSMDDNKTHSLSKKSSHRTTLSASVDDGLFSFQPSPRRFTSDSDSSLSPPPTPSRAGTGPSSPPDPSYSCDVKVTNSPHDLCMATSRTRAPVLRVFVPCSELTDDETTGYGTITQCEDQLCDVGLWDHLSVGDIVCNLGYVPATENGSLGSGSRTSSDGDLNSSATSASTMDIYQNRISGHWLLFNGEKLVLFSPPTPPPVANALSLPTPYYYAHLAPPMQNPLFTLSCAPHNADTTVINRIQLNKITAKVRSPQSPMGYATVKKYAWTIKIHVNQLPPSFGEIGEGWRGEWVLESEGTKEGRLALEQFVLNQTQAPCLWEFVKEKSQSGQLWLRLLRIPKP